MAKHQGESTYLYGQYANIRKDIFGTSRNWGKTFLPLIMYIKRMLKARKTYIVPFSMYKCNTMRMRENTHLLTEIEYKVIPPFRYHNHEIILIPSGVLAVYSMTAYKSLRRFFLKRQRCLFKCILALFSRILSFFFTGQNGHG